MILFSGHDKGVQLLKHLLAKKHPQEVFKETGLFFKRPQVRPKNQTVSEDVNSLERITFIGHSSDVTFGKKSAEEFSQQLITSIEALEKQNPNLNKKLKNIDLLSCGTGLLQKNRGGIGKKKINSFALQVSQILSNQLSHKGYQISVNAISNIPLTHRQITEQKLKLHFLFDGKEKLRKKKWDSIVSHEEIFFSSIAADERGILSTHAWLDQESFDEKYTLDSDADFLSSMLNNTHLKLTAIHEDLAKLPNSVDNNKKIEATHKIGLKKSEITELEIEKKELELQKYILEKKPFYLKTLIENEKNLEKKKILKSQLEPTVKELEKSISNLTEEVNKNNTNIENKNKKISDLEKDIELAREKIAKLKKTGLIETLKSLFIPGYKNEKANSLKKEVETFSEKNNTITILKSENHAAQKENKEKEKKIKALSEEKSEKLNTLHDLNQKISKIESSINKKQEEIQKLEKNFHFSLDKEIDSIKNILKIVSDGVYVFLRRADEEHKNLIIQAIKENPEFGGFDSLNNRKDFESFVIETVKPYYEKKLSETYDKKIKKEKNQEKKSDLKLEKLLFLYKMAYEDSTEIKNALAENTDREKSIYLTFQQTDSPRDLLDQQVNRCLIIAKNYEKLVQTHSLKNIGLFGKISENTEKKQQVSPKPKLR